MSKTQLPEQQKKHKWISIEMLSAEYIVHIWNSKEIKFILITHYFTKKRTLNIVNFPQNMWKKIPKKKKERKKKFE